MSFQTVASMVLLPGVASAGGILHGLGGGSKGDGRAASAGDRRESAVCAPLVARPPRGGSVRSDLPCGIDDRVAELRQEAPVVEVPPRVEIGPMVGGDGAPSTPQHPAAPDYRYGVEFDPAGI